jgi:hypothetical protein
MDKKKKDLILLTGIFLWIEKNNISIRKSDNVRKKIGR